MSAKTAKSTNVVLTDKFKKELEKFFEWAAVSEYIIKDINNDQHEWNMKLLNKFEEPGRNKLEAYIKALFAKYTISMNEMDIEDAKLLAKEFKEKGDKVKKASKKETTENEEKPKKSEKAKTTKKSKEVESEAEVEVEESVKLDMSLDTSETFNVDTLEFWTSELVQVFGKPKKTGGKDDEHTWEWKVEVNGQPFSIYDWNENGDSFDEATWYLGATSDNKKNIKTLVKYIESWFDAPSDVEAEVEGKPKKETKKVEKVEKAEKPKKETKKAVKKVVEVKEEIKEVQEIEDEKKVDMEELFGSDSDMDDDIELDLNDIEDDE